MPDLFSKLMESEEPLVKNGDLTEKTLLRRAQWLHADLLNLRMPKFQILPTREVEHPDTGLIFQLVEYSPGPTGHDVDQAAPGFKKDPHFIGGTALDSDSLARFAQISEIGHTLIPHLWLGKKMLRELERTIERLIAKPLADAILASAFGEGGRICADLGDGRIVFL